MKLIFSYKKHKTVFVINDRFRRIGQMTTSASRRTTRWMHSRRTPTPVIVMQDLQEKSDVFNKI